jgi:Uma2 family endonuclease
MSAAASPPVKATMTAEEFLALPDDGEERWLIRGELRPKEPRMSVRNWKHGRAVTKVAKILDLWLDGQPEPRGAIVTGDTGFRLRRTPDSLVGIDVAFASAELMATAEAGGAYLDGPPVLAIEVLSPSDKHGEVVEKINAYLEAGVVVWLVDPDIRFVRVHRPGQVPETFHETQELSGEPYLPGFRVPVAALFAP